MKAYGDDGESLTALEERYKKMPSYETAIAPFLSEIEKMEQELIKRVELFRKTDLKRIGSSYYLSEVDLIVLDAELDFFDELISLGYESKIQEYIQNYDTVVYNIHQEAIKRGVAGIVGTSIEDLEILAKNDEIFMLDKGRLYTQQFKNAIFRSIIGGKTIGELLLTLGDILLNYVDKTIAISTGISRFYATSTAKVFEESPKQKFRLEGALDVKTRASCRAVFINQPKDGLNKAEIDAGAWTKLALKFMNQYEHSSREVKTIQERGYTFIERGGYNCRHQPKPKGIEL